MDFARRAAAGADADDIYGMRIPSPDAHMTIDELRQEHFHEGILQQVILAELAERWKLEAKFQRELSLYGGGASSSPHREPLDVPLSLSGASTSRLHIKDQIMESYEPPWRRVASEEDAPIVGSKLCKNAISGMKRKRTAESPSLMCSICDTKCYCDQENIAALLGGGKETEEKLHEKKALQLAHKSQKSVSRWMCIICDANCKSQFDLESHLGGRRHQDNIKALQGEGKGTEAKLHEKKEPQLADMNQIPVSRWMCSICNANCTSQSDLDSHLRSRRHQVQALQGEVKGTKPKLYEKNEPWLLDMNQKPSSRWMCSICKSTCTSQSDLESHLGGRRHQENIEALQGEGKGTGAKLYEKNASQLADMNQKPSPRWMCSICNANCKSQSNLESHIGGRRHQENIEALQGECKGTEVKLYEKKEPQLADMNQEPSSRWMCSICNANCTSQSNLEDHLRGRRHQENIEALQGEGMGTEAKLYANNEAQLADMSQQPSARWMCNICNASCTSQSNLESHLGGRRHQENIEALQGEGKGTEAKLYEKKELQFADMDQKSFSRWMCNICNANCTSQSNLESHLRGRRHQENIEDLQGEGIGTEAKLYEKNEPQVLGMSRKPSSKWMCNICNANCTSQSELASHLGGRRHQENIEALQGEGKGTKANLHEKKEFADKSQKSVSRWMCTICHVNCTSQSVLGSHFRGRRHQENIESLQGEGMGTEEKLHENKAPQFAYKNHKPVPGWVCSLCNADCASQSDLKSHLQGRRHERNLQAQA
ncbi:zinc finger protein 346-like [Lolium rigidum]|uniref:zinc finger protein 346-like n=1 Tax=Lolium rigidum TaxID=89674 RepID=UPI001F5D6CCE|nr:zinc finger protein 346-like [Lolium rigidum]